MEPWSPVTALLGAALVLFMAYDLLRTVLTVSGGGPLTTRLGSWTWRLALHLATSEKEGRVDPPDWLSALGPVIAAMTLLVWLAGLWAGWTLVFSGSEGAIVSATDRTPASFVERVYYAGYTLTTLGPGDFTPGSPLWQMATVLGAINGLFLFTMASTYIVPIVAATAAQRELATLINALGDGPGDILVRAWHEDGFSTLEDHLVSFAPTIATVRQQHLAYPILHYFHSTEPKAALPVQMAVLDEALMLLAHGVEPWARPSPPTLGPLRTQIRGYLATLASTWIEPIHPPPEPFLDRRCAEVGIPMRDTDSFLRTLDEEESGRRAHLLGLVRSDGWRWSHVGGEERGHGAGGGRTRGSA